ncbi:hypothetical protein TD95_001577 [Thielaviopsis punctulata]|uniref:NADPH-dependent diflavin oxidoreductase 1 n=1 Tax=Thielaviopsis punctulata TaxID=72032 RepID=A0A0F4ZG64_9PEZI|nr:hypothetical protein TD95_001577 [Thielaviopsis punctulata]
MESKDAQGLQSRSVLVGYGTEMGNSLDLAEQLSRMAQRLRFKVDLREMNSVQLSSLFKYSLVLFVVSTTGLGEMPKNASVFWKRLLRKKLTPGCLSGVNYAIFGLGDSSYQQFNWASLKLSKRLTQLGATEMLERGEADQQHPDGIDQVYIPWLESFKKHLLSQFPLPTGVELIPDSDPLPPQVPIIFKPKSSLAPIQKSTPELLRPTPKTTKPASPDGPLSEHFGMLEILGPVQAAPSNIPIEIPSITPATLVLNKRVTPANHWQDVRLLKFQISAVPETGFPLLMPGDTLNLYAKNFAVDVDNLIAWMGWQDVASSMIDWDAMGPIPSDLPKNSSFTLRDLLLHSLDIFAVPSRTFFEKLSHFASDPNQKERLLDFGKPEFSNEYYDYATRPRRSILEVLQEFETVRIPVNAVLDIFPVIRARQYSIANWPQVDEARGIMEVELLVALVKYRTVLKRVRRGLVSRYLEDLPEKTDMYVTFTTSSSKVYGSANAQRPLVCVATGTGIAPIRSLIQERRSNSAASIGPMTLYFGCRNEASDFHFASEWKSLAAEERLVLKPAFSRDSQTKIYVQDLLRKDKAALAEWVGKNAVFYVCGGSRKMADAVKEIVKDSMVEFGGVESREQVDTAFRGVSWVEEIW